jgi:hypothetical protein
MQIEQPRIFGLSREIVPRLQRSAEMANGLPDFCGETIEMFRVPRRITAAEAVTGNGRRQIPDEAQE